MSRTIDCVIPVHQKDVYRLPACVSGLRRNLREVGGIVVVTDLANEPRIDEAMASIGETRYRCVSEQPFLDDTPAPAGPARARQWVVQQVIKLEGFRFVTTDYYLVLDADVVFLNETPLFDADGNVTVAIDPPRVTHPSHPLARKCLAFCSGAHHLLKTPWQLHAACYTCHHMVFHIQTVRRMLAAIGGDWKAAIRHIQPFTEVFAEYDAYPAYVSSQTSSTLVHRTAPWLDVPWCGGTAAGLEEYLDVFRRAGVSFVALHHHFDGKLTTEECMDFARETCREAGGEDWCGRWPLTQWLARRELRLAHAGLLPAPGCTALFGLADQAFTAAVVDLATRYAHVREHGTFGAAPPQYEPRALERARVDVLELNAAFTRFANAVLAPMFRAGFGDGFDAVWALVDDIERRCDRITALVSGSGPKRLVSADEMAHAVDALRLAFSRLAHEALARLDVPALGRDIDWQSLDTADWIAIVRFLADQSPDIVALARWLSRVLAPEQWAAIRPVLEHSVPFADHVGATAGTLDFDRPDFAALTASETALEASCT